MDEPKIRVEAPSSLLGESLVQQLRGHGARVVQVDGGGWAVEVPAGTRERILTSVQRWLEDESLGEVVVHVDGSSYTMTPNGRG